MTNGMLLNSIRRSLDGGALALCRAVARIRNALARATHDFFQSHGFLYVHTPIITTSDCEGAGEMFQVPAHCSASYLCNVRGDERGVRGEQDLYIRHA